MSNKNKQKVDMKSIKEYEKAQRSTLKVEDSKVEVVNFDHWWASRSSTVKLAPHMKEIVHADFKGRGLEQLNTMEKWDWAARQFGLNI